MTNYGVFYFILVFQYPAKYKRYYMQVFRRLTNIICALTSFFFPALFYYTRYTYEYVFLFGFSANDAINSYFIEEILTRYFFHYRVAEYISIYG